ncbi:MAG: 6-carboxytetrahydropterin synthase [Dehalococcoidales bacterium]|jgi:6-pyruvoyltetrahydropterin/6-carboxytetrahydropterin synthase
MYGMTKTMEISVGHCLDLPYSSPCERQHGHNLKIGISIQGYELTEYGMLIDFAKIKDIVQKLDHQNLNSILPINPTAENIAKWIYDEIEKFLECEKYPESIRVARVSVQESDGNMAWYEL